MYLHFMSFLHIYKTKVVDILIEVRQECTGTYSTWKISWVLMSWRRIEARASAIMILTMLD